MKRYTLKWFDLGKVGKLYPILHNQSESFCLKDPYIGSALTPAGIYIFFNDFGRVIDVGEANPNHRMKLRWRIRNEIYDNSASVKKFRDIGIEHDALFELTIKVAHVIQGINHFDDTETDKSLRLIERALICETDPLSHSHGGVEQWHEEEIQITNIGDFEPLKAIIKRFTGEYCQKQPQL